MTEEHKERCIVNVERDIDFVRHGGFKSQLDEGMIKSMFNIDRRRKLEKYFGEDINIKIRWQK